MRKAYINSTDKESAASDYQIEIKYDDGKVSKESITAYSYSSIFDHIKENHENENDKKVQSIKIDFIR